MGDRSTSFTSYLGALVSVIAGLTLTEWGIIVGIITAILTFGLNAWYKHKENQRQEEAHRLLIEQHKHGVTGA